MQVLPQTETLLRQDDSASEVSGVFRNAATHYAALVVWQGLSECWPKLPRKFEWRFLHSTLLKKLNANTLDLLFASRMPRSRFTQSPYLRTKLYVPR